MRLNIIIYLLAIILNEACRCIYLTEFIGQLAFDSEVIVEKCSGPAIQITMKIKIAFASQFIRQLHIY